MARRVLCIDDDQEMCEMMSALLGHAGYEVTQALSFSQGLSLSRKGGFDLIVLDWIYQDGIGVELCRRIREFDDATPILFLSGVSEQASIDEALAAGAQGYMVKPMGVEGMLQTVSRIAGKGCGMNQERG